MGFDGFDSFDGFQACKRLRGTCLEIGTFSRNRGVEHISAFSIQHSAFITG